MTERIRVSKASGILGVSVRALQDMAARGEVPSAAKIGRVWTFNEAALRRFVRQKEGEASCRKTFTAVAGSGGRESKSADTKYERAYTQHVWTKPDAA
jgi:hypothetical protein